MRKFLILVAVAAVLVGTQTVLAQPRLVVHLVVDQMRADYLYRFD